ENLMHSHHQIEKCRAVTENDSEQFRSFRRCAEDGIDRDLEFLFRRANARLRFGEFPPQLSRAVFDQLDEDFVLGFEMEIEGAQADVSLGGNVSDAGLMIALAGNDAFSSLDQVQARLFAPAMEAIGRGFVKSSSRRSHGSEFIFDR